MIILLISVAGDPIVEVTEFISEFDAKFGSVHPVFYHGSYNQALNDAKRELKFLLVYLHSNSHQDTNEFCKSILGHKKITDFIDQNNILFWGCSVDRAEGFQVSQALREGGYPFLVLIVLKNNRMVVVERFEGKETLNRESLLTRLKRSIEENELSLITARLEREERNMTHLLRQEQDQAFLESLEVDKEKERKKQEERNKKEAELQAKKKQELEIIKRRERLERLKIDLADKIPPEPNPTDALATKIVIKLPNGTRLERHFLKNQSIKYLYFFVFCHDQSPLQFQIRTNFPPRDLPGKPPVPEDFDFEEEQQQINHHNDVDPPTFEECDLGKGAMLFVHDLEA